MKNGIFGLNSVILGGLAAGLSIAIVLGSLLLALTEGGRSSTFDSFPTLESVNLLTPTATPTLGIPTITPTRNVPPTSTPQVVLEESAEIENCEFPIGWLPYTIKRSDTLNKLSTSTGISPQQLADANCLSQSQLTPDSIIFLPPASPTSPPVTCGAPRNWVAYYIQRGDTLFDIAQRVNSTVSQIKNANCLSSNDIRTGQKLYVPYLPAPKPNPTLILPTETSPPPTSTQALPATSTQAPPPTSTQSPQPTSTQALPPTSTQAPPPTNTQVPLPTNTQAPQPTPTEAVISNLPHPYPSP